MFDLNVARTMQGLAPVNTVAVPMLDTPVRFQICPGTDAGAGIQGLAFTLAFGGNDFAAGTTTADGDVLVPSLLLLIADVTVKMLGGDYVVSANPALPAIGTIAGQQKRLEVLGYVQGYQLAPLLNNVFDDGADSPRHQQAIMNFQADRNPPDALAIDGVIGPATSGVLRTQVGG